MLLGLVPAVSAQTPSVRLLCDAVLKAGDRYTMAVDVTVNDTVVYSQDGVPGFEEAQQRVLALVGELQIQTVDARGRFQTGLLRIQRLEGSFNQNPIVSPPAGVQLALNAANGRLVVTAPESQGQAWVEAWTPLWPAIMDLDVSSRSLGEVFNPANPVRPGQAWLGQAEPMAVRLKESGLLFSGDGRIQEVSANFIKTFTFQDQPAAQFQMVTRLTGVQPAAVAQDIDLRIQTSSMSVTRTQAQLLQTNRLPIQAVVDLKSRGVYGTAGGVEIERNTKLHRITQWTLLPGS